MADTKRRPKRKPAGDGIRETRNFSVTSVDEGVREAGPDAIAVEEPLEIRLVFHENGELVDQSISITMRTPGNDLELALGFLFTESIIQSYDQIESAAPATARLECNVVRIQLKPNTRFDAKLLQRNFYTTSSCGVCAKSSLEALRVSGVSRIEPNSFRVSADIVRSLPDKLRQAQSVFASTGGLHAAGLFGPQRKTAPGARGRGPPQRGGQAGWRVAVLRSSTRDRKDSARQRSHQLRDRPEDSSVGGSHSGRSQCSLQPGDSTGRGVRSHTAGLPPRIEVQYLQRGGTDSSLKPSQEPGSRFLSVPDL